MWYAVYFKDAGTFQGQPHVAGQLYSIGTVLAAALPSEFGVVELGDGFELRGKVWDAALLAFVVDTGEAAIEVILARLMAITELANLPTVIQTRIQTRIREVLFTT